MSILSSKFMLKVYQSLKWRKFILDCILIYGYGYDEQAGMADLHPYQINLIDVQYVYSIFLDILFSEMEAEFLDAVSTPDPTLNNIILNPTLKWIFVGTVF